MADECCALTANVPTNLQICRTQREPGSEASGSVRFPSLLRMSVCYAGVLQLEAMSTDRDSCGTSSTQRQPGTSVVPVVTVGHRHRFCSKYSALTILTL